MSAEQDINRELLLLAGEINDSEKRLSELRNRVRELGSVSEYAESEVEHLTKSLDRIKLEFAEAVNLLYKEQP